MNSKLCNGIRSFIAAILHQFSVYPLFMMSNIIPFMIDGMTCFLHFFHFSVDFGLKNGQTLCYNKKKKGQAQKLFSYAKCL